MKKPTKLYYIFSYLFFLYPPFIWGLVAIYDVTLDSREHIATLYVNAILIIVLILVFIAMIHYKKLKKPSLLEQKHLLFGFISNVIVYFYTFQNLLKIDQFINIYLVLLLILGVHYLLIARTLKAKELWILLPIFLIIDYVHYAISGCAWMDYGCDNPNTLETIIGVSLYYIFVIAIYTYYIREMLNYRVLKGFKVINAILGIVIVSMVLFVEDLPDTLEKVLLTVVIVFAFLLIVDFIVSILVKQYTHRMLLYYIRLLTLLVVALILGVSRVITDPSIDQSVLPIMVIATYVSLAINILSVLMKVDDKNTTATQINAQFNVEESNGMSHLYMTVNDQVVGHLEYQTLTFRDVEFKQVSVFCIDLPDAQGLSVLIEALEKEVDGSAIIHFEPLKYIDSIHRVFDELGYVYMYNEDNNGITYIKK
jgi:hypothetical protein